MNNIKEILNNLEDAGFMYKRISPEEIKKILDYITNLQEELEEQKRIEKASLETINNLQEENERLKEILHWKQIENNIFYKSRIDKAIISLTKNKYIIDLEEVLNILQGSDKEWN